MLKIITSLVMFASGLIANAQQQETRAVSTFNKIEVTDAVKVVYTQSGSPEMKVVTADGHGMSQLVTNVSNQTLIITCPGNRGESVIVYASSPELVSVKAYHDAQVSLAAPLQTPEFSAMLASHATLNGIVRANGATVLKGKSGAVFNIRVESATLDGYFFSGAKANLSGDASAAELTAKDDALCNARNFSTRRIAVDASQRATVTINAMNVVDVSVSDMAKVNYYGKPRELALNPEAIASKKETLAARN